MSSQSLKSNQKKEIPKDWSQTNLQKITVEIGDGIHSTPKYVKQSQIFFINGNNLIKDFIKISDNTKCVDELEFKKYKKNINKNTLLLSINGTIGNLAFYKNEKVVLGKSIAYINLQKNIDKNFVFYFLKSDFVKNFINDELTGTTIKNLSLGTIREIPIILPNDDKEQQKIVQILFNTDELIKQLDYLIIKKKNIKQGTMQELLTGEKRLEGFNKSWNDASFGDVFDITAGGDLNKEFFSEIQDDKHPFSIYSNSLKNSGLYGFSSVFQYENDSITVTARGTIGKANVRFKKYSAIGRVLILKPKRKLNCFFIAEYINKRIKFSIESTGVPQLTAPQISKYLLNLPEFDEQFAIAEVLTDMDSEIQELESKREKYIMIKNGMMQKLLTGEIRLT
jgi:type I restriction enzyme, S subunit